MKLVQTMSIAFLLVSAVAALPLASPLQASAQIAPPPEESFGFDDAITTHGNTTGMSFLAVFGASMVDGAEVTGVVMNSENEVSVTMASENGTGQSDAVTVVVFTSTMNMMSSMFSHGPMTSLMNGSSLGNSSIASTDNDDNSGPGSNGDDDDGELDDSGFDSPSDFDDFLTEDFGGDDDTAFGSSASPMGLFENVKTGSSVIPQGWNSPQSVTVTLVGDATMPAEESDTTFVFVMIFPYTAETTQTIGEG